MSDTKPSDLDLGYLLTGVIRREPDGAHYIELPGDDGKPQRVDVFDLFEKYKGQEVRMTLVATEMIARIASLVEAADSESDPSLS